MTEIPASKLASRYVLAASYHLRIPIGEVVQCHDQIAREVGIDVRTRDVEQLPCIDGLPRGAGLRSRRKPNVR
jgi:hypothetical protein